MIEFYMGFYGLMEGDVLRMLDSGGIKTIRKSVRLYQLDLYSTHP
jgi:hypothetical protein